VIIEGVAGFPTSLGFVGLSYAEQNLDRVKILGVDAGEGCVVPDITTVSVTYPSPAVIIYPSLTKIAENPAIALVDYYLSDEGPGHAEAVGCRSSPGRRDCRPPPGSPPPAGNHRLAPSVGARPLPGPRRCHNLSRPDNPQPEGRMTAATPGAPLRVSDLQGSARRRRKEGIIRGLFLAAAGLAILISILIVLSLASEAVLFLTKIDLGQLTSLTWQPRADDWGIIALIAGTVQVALIAMLIATPLGLGAAIYLAEYASPRMRGILKPIRDPARSPAGLELLRHHRVEPHRGGHDRGLHARLHRRRRGHRGGHPVAPSSRRLRTRCTRPQLPA
jgi:hypothetical protein